MFVKTYDERQDVTTRSMLIGTPSKGATLHFSWANQKGDWWRKNGTPKFLWASRYKAETCHGSVLHIGRLAIALMFPTPQRAQA